MSSDERRPFHNKIFFCDIVGYSRLPPVRQYRCQRDLTQAVRTTLDDMRVTLEEDAIALPTGDGLVLNFLVQQPDIHLRTATDVLKHLHEARSSAGEGIGLRVGLNSHVDAVVVDINNKKNIVGNGINFAQRVMDLGRPDQILMHDCVRLDLENYPDYANKIIYRGEYTVKHNKQVPVSQFVDNERTYINNELLIAPSPVKPAPGTTLLDTILRHRIQENLLRIVLDSRAHAHLDDVRDYISDFLDGRGEFQRLKIAVPWIASEMLDNALRYGNVGPEKTVVLSVDRTKSGILVEVEQPDIAGFDLDLVLSASEEFSFMRLMNQRGLHWKQRRATDRLTLSVEISRDFEIRAITVLPLDGSATEMPADVRAFVEGLTDACVHDRISFIRVPVTRIDRTTESDVGRLLENQIQPNLRVIVDLGRVEYIDSVGLRILMLTAKKSRATEGSTIAMAAVGPVVREIFEISRFNMVFPIYVNSEAAFRTLIGRPAS